MINTDTIAAISTPPVAGGIAVIRISGGQATRLAEKVFQPYHGVKVQEMRGYTCAYGAVSEAGEMLDDAVLTVFRAPHSFTGEDVAELSCHGGIYLTKRILGLLYRLGARPAEPGEFTKRAFLNGKLSLSQAEAVMDVISAEGEAALRQANLAKQGRLGKAMREISGELTETLAAMTYWLDDAEEFPPELAPEHIQGKLSGICARLRQFSSQYDAGRILREGVRTVLLGRPNAGKSTVMNWLCGMQRSIVTEIAGTTRDVVTEQVRIGDYTLLLSDTAGIRDSADPIESIGINLAKQSLETADLVLYVVDLQEGLSDADREMLTLCKNRKLLLIWNKSDLSDREPDCTDHPAFVCSAKYDRDFSGFAAALRGVLGELDFAVPVVMNERQRALVDSAAESVASALALHGENAETDVICYLLECAANALLEFEGERVMPDVIDRVFEKFCVGK